MNQQADVTTLSAIGQGKAWWPDIPYLEWRDSCTTRHLWAQVMGKIRLARTPWLNHSGHVALYVSARGLATSLIAYDSRSFEIKFNFQDHTLDSDPVRV